MAKFPTVEMVSRDRGSAYAGAADVGGKLQVADGFHLIDCSIHAPKCRSPARP